MSSSKSERENRAGLDPVPIINRPNIQCSRFEGKNIIVTAGTVGIGRAIAERLGQEKAKVFICSRKKHNVEKAVAEMREKGYQVSGIPCHVGKDGDLENLVHEALEFFDGTIHGVVSNAAVNPLAGPTLDLPENLYDKIMDVNVKSYWKLVKLCKPFFCSVNGGSIVFISSVGGYQPSPPVGIYGMSKSALIALAKVLSNDLGQDNIRVNGIAPGLIRTRMSEAFWKGPMADNPLNRTYLGRHGDPEDIAGVAAFLLSDDSAFITGETIVVSGGGNSRL